MTSSPRPTDIARDVLEIEGAALARLRFLGTDKAHLKHAAPPAGAPHPSRLGAPVRAATVAFLQVRTL